VRLIRGDITKLQAAGVGCGFRFVLDLGAMHDLNKDARTAVGREVNAVAAANASALVLAWVPARRGLWLPCGASRQDIEAVFPGRRVVDEEVCNVTGAPRFVQEANPRFYRLRRN
jgi:hypothetical protein